MYFRLEKSAETRMRCPKRLRRIGWTCGGGAGDLAQFGIECRFISLVHLQTSFCCLGWSPPAVW